MLLHSTLLFLDFSGGEFLLIAVVFLLFFGSKSIPGMARTLGKAMRDFKEAANSVQREISESANINEVTEVKKTTTSSPALPQQAVPPASTISQETVLPESPKSETPVTPEEEKPEK